MLIRSSYYARRQSPIKYLHMLYWRLQSAEYLTKANTHFVSIYGFGSNENYESHNTCKYAFNSHRGSHCCVYFPFQSEFEKIPKVAAKLGRQKKSLSNIRYISLILMDFNLNVFTTLYLNCSIRFFLSFVRAMLIFHSFIQFIPPYYRYRCQTETFQLLEIVYKFQ